MTSQTWRRPGYDFDPSSVSSLPPGAYANAAVHDQELRTAFSPGAGLVYMGHDILLPEVGHRRCDSDPRLVLTRDQDHSVRLLANLCTHACRPLLNHDDAVAKPRLTCAYHDWTFRADGSLIGGANFDLGRGEEAERRRAALQIPAFELLSWTRPHRADDGSYWTGIVYPERSYFPAEERTAYTSAAIILTADAYTGTSSASSVFLPELDAVDDPKAD